MSDDASSFEPTTNIYISYSSLDQVLLDELLEYLTSLPWEESTTLYFYHEGQILAEEQREKIESRLNAADVVVILVTSAYLDSVNTRQWELEQITNKQDAIAINFSPVKSAVSQFQKFCSTVLDYSTFTSWEGQLESLKSASAEIYEAASSKGFVSFSAIASNWDAEVRGVEMSVDSLRSSPTRSPDSKNIERFKKQLETALITPETPQKPTPTNKDLVDCSVFSPPAVACGDAFLVQVFVHLPEQAEIAKQQAEIFDADAKQVGVKSLGIPIERGTQLSFSLSIPKLEVDDPIQNLIWNGKPDSVQFGVTVPPDLTQKTVIGTVTVSQNSIPIGHLKFKLSIAAASDSKESQPVGEAARLYKKAFVSYSSKDRKEVLKRVQGLSVTGIEVFQDVLNLEPGDRWEKELYRHINECDLFLLFWSTAAKESNWVIKEVQYALERQGKDGLNPPEIIPVIIEGPPLVPPPDELQHLHFNDKLLYLMALS